MKKIIIPVLAATVVAFIAFININKVPKHMANNMQTATLSNGMKLIVIPDHRSAVVLHSVWYQAGSMDEVKGTTGIAHMLEHLMFKGTKTRKAGERDLIVTRNGGQENAFTSRDYTAYYQKISKEKLPTMMELEADRMVNLSLTNEDFLPERNVVLEERRMRTDSSPASKFQEQLIKAHYGNTPYAHPVIGWQADIEGYVLKNAIDWYKTYYAPNNATLILTGDITLKEALPMVEKYYGKNKPAKTPQRKFTPTPMPTEPKTLVREDKEVKVPIMVRFYPAPSATMPTEDATDAPALEVLTEILGGGQTGRLYKELVKKQQIADSANADYDVTAFLEGSIDISIQPKANITLKQVEKSAEKVIENLIKNGVTEEELSRVKMSIKSTDIYARDDLFHTVYRLGIWLMAGGTPEGFDSYISKVEKVTVKDVQTVAKKYLNKNHSTTGYLVADKSQLGE